MVSREDAAVPGYSPHHHGRVGRPSPVRKREFQDADTVRTLGCDCLLLQWPTRTVLRLVAVLRVSLARIGSQLRLILEMPIIERWIKNTVQLSTLAPILSRHIWSEYTRHDFGWIGVVNERQRARRGIAKSVRSRW